MRTAEQYKQSLRDGREVYFEGQRVEDVTTHPVIGVAVNHAAIDYEIADDPAYRDLTIYKDSKMAGSTAGISKFPSLQKIFSSEAG